MAEYIQAQLVGPVQILQHDQHRTARIRGDQQVGQVLHEQAAAVVRVTGVCGDRAHPRRQALPEVAQGRVAG